MRRGNNSPSRRSGPTRGPRPEWAPTTRATYCGANRSSTRGGMSYGGAFRVPAPTARPARSRTSGIRRTTIGGTRGNGPPSPRTEPTGTS